VTDIHQLSAEQYGVLSSLILYGREIKATPMEILAAVETGLVEDTLHNLDSGDGTSVGWRQETAESYGAATGPRLDLSKTIPAFYAEMRAVRGQYPTSGELAAAVQRPAAKYVGRYGEEENQAKLLIGEFHGTGRPPWGPVTGNESFGAAPGKPAGLAAKIVVTQQPDPKSHGPKVEHTGKTMSEFGQHFKGHAAAMRSMAARQVKL
jgi:hypothetical protein